MQLLGIQPGGNPFVVVFGQGNGYLQQIQTGFGDSPLTRAIGETWHRHIWESPLESRPPWQRGLINGLRIIQLLIRDLAEGQITLRAMGLVYTTLLSMVPLLAVSFSVLKGFGVHNQVRPLLLKLLEPLGEKGVEITDQIITFVDNVQVGVLGAVGLALLFYTVISLLQKVERAFNYTWRVSRPRPLSQRFSDYLSVILFPTD